MLEHLAVRRNTSVYTDRPGENGGMAAPKYASGALAQTLLLVTSDRPLRASGNAH